MTQNWNPENWGNIPTLLRDRAQWMVCGDDKVPRSIHSGYPADNTDSRNWASFNDAERYAYQHGMWIGFCFSAGGGLTCIDLDNKADLVVDPQTHAENQARMQSMYRFYDTYIEQSKSGNGLHIILQGEIGTGRRRDNVEVYSQERFIIITGDVQKARPLLQAQAMLDSLVAQMTQSQVDHITLEEVPPVESDAELAARIFRSKSSAKFEALIAPNWYEQTNPNSGAPYGEDPSRADLSFATLLGFFTPSNGQIWSMFKQTALGQRTKNGQDRHPSYDRFLVHTIKEARAYLASDAARHEAPELVAAAANMLEQFKAKQLADAAAQTAKVEDPAQSAALNWRPESDHQIVTKHQFHFQKPYEIVSEKPMEWALENVFAKQSVNAIYGWSAVGKSFIALDLMMAVAEGKEWFGHETEMMHVSYLALEGSEGMRNRLEAYRIGRGVEYQLPMNFDIFRGKFNICDPEHVSAMIYQRQQAGMVGGMFVIDTFAKATLGKDENSAQDMGQAVQMAELIKDQLQACVVIVHHSTKPNSETGIAGGLRGSGSIQAGIDGVIQVAKREHKEDDRVVLEKRFILMDKVKEGADSGYQEFVLNVVKIGERVRKCGEIVPITSCNVINADQLRNQVNSPLAPLPAADEPTYDYGGNGGATRPSRNGKAKRAGSTQAPIADQPLSAKQSEETEFARLPFKTAVRDAMMVAIGRTGSTPLPIDGMPPGKVPIPRKELINEIIGVLNPTCDPKHPTLKNRINAAIAYAADSNKIGKIVSNGIQYFYLLEAM